jgi:23S rRNA pseudouridine2604 synthase
LTEKVRLSKLMSQRGICSRREADRFIEQGMVAVDGEIVNVLGSKVYPDQEISLSQGAKAQQSKFATVLVNKPPGYVSGLPEKGYTSAIMLVAPKNAMRGSDRVRGRHGLAPAGRLDIDSTGLIVFTQDGRIARQLVGADSIVEKEYIVTVRGDITDEKLAMLGHGLELDGKPLRHADVRLLDRSQLKFTLTEGRKRQIRRMCEQVDLAVTHLVRTRIGNVRLGSLPRGKWRLLDLGETF